MHTTPPTALRTLFGALAAAAALSCGRPSPATGPTAVHPTPPPRLRVIAARWEEPRVIADAGARANACLERPYGCFRRWEPTWPAVATNGAGAAVAVWQRYAAGTYQMVGARFDPRRGWGQEQPIDTPRASRPPQLAVDRQGRATAVWIADGAVYASRSEVDGGWTTPVALAVGSSAALTVDDDGRATIVATRADGVDAVRADARGEWAPSERLDDQAFDVATTSLTEDGTVVAVWTQGASANIWGYGREWTQTRMRTARPGESWSPTSVVNDIENANAYFLHSTGGDTLAFVDSGQEDVSPSKVYAQRRTAAGWSAPFQLREPGPPASSWKHPPRLARLGDETLAAWMEFTGGSRGRHFIWTRTFSKETGWGPQVTVVDRAGEGSTTIDMRLATSAAGNAVLVWGALGAGNGLLASDFVPRRGWSAPRQLRSGSGSAAEIAMDDAGNASVVWSEFGDPLTIHAARLVAVTAPAP